MTLWHSNIQLNPGAFKLEGSIRTCVKHCLLWIRLRFDVRMFVCTVVYIHAFSTLSQHFGAETKSLYMHMYTFWGILEDSIFSGSKVNNNPCRAITYIFKISAVHFLCKIICTCGWYVCVPLHVYMINTSTVHFLHVAPVCRVKIHLPHLPLEVILPFAAVTVDVSNKHQIFLSCPCVLIIALLLFHLGFMQFCFGHPVHHLTHIGHVKHNTHYSCFTPVFL